ncbi:hypothetical protein Cgig2_026110 [Carnegiea gigantea]|uniref:Uncharacterized protein n=1 Tax=Carnegiea gigantea TaxID=171969 RepID=A0A9Q1JLV8_9CARY|nr:hypothetical protein Cgig2_026110 [Carnegiea gigantea]
MREKKLKPKLKCLKFHVNLVSIDIDRENYINSLLLCGDKHCIDQIRMSPIAFFRLCEALERKLLFVSTMNMSVKEQVLMFLHLIGHNVRFRAIGGRFFRSTWSIHTYFHAVLQAILKLYPESPEESPAAMDARRESEDRGEETETTWKKGKMKEVNEAKKTQFRWSKSMSKELLTFLANEVQKGNRPNNSFKSSSYVAPANAISKKFDVKCSPEHIDNHLSIVKNAWVVISKLRDKDSVVSFNRRIQLMRSILTRKLICMMKWPLWLERMLLEEAVPSHLMMLRYTHMVIR